MKIAFKVKTKGPVSPKI